MPFRINNVLVAIDLTAASDRVLRSAAELSALAGAALHVVHAVETPDDEAGALTEQRRRTAERALRGRLEETISEICPVSSMRVAPGRADEVILQRALDAGVDLILVGPHREDRAGTNQLGSTADRVVRRSTVPCLIVREPLSLPLRRVLVPSDFSDASSAALDVALVWSAALRMPTRSGERTHLEVLHVVPESAGSRADSLRSGLEEQIEEACERTGCAAPLALSSRVVAGGPVVREILEQARTGSAELLVMGTRGASERENGIGGVSAAIAREAVCPLLLVPPGLWQRWKEREDSVKRAVSGTRSSTPGER